MSDVKCMICKNTDNNRLFSAREMMLGMRTTFEYLECGSCGCLNIITEPENIGYYYPQGYYSYKTQTKQRSSGGNLLKIKRFFRSILMDAYLDESNLLGKMISPKLKHYYPWIKKNTINTHSRILDVGCGSGDLLQTMYNDGFRHLSGLDPFIEQEINYQSGIKIYKQKPEELSGQYDVIMMHHAFEHMSNPLEVLQKMNQLLSPNGYLIIRIPVADSYAWGRYRENWVQLDAPRHSFLHTEKSMSILSEQSLFKILDITYDSDEFQFTGSEKYSKGIALNEHFEEYTENELSQFKIDALKLNASRSGDQACYYLRKSNT